MNSGKSILAGLLVSGMSFMGLVGCKATQQVPDPAPAPVQSPEATPLPFRSVVGNARFGSQCPYGSFVDPQPVSLELWSCPLGLESIELQEALPAIVLQADCKKKTMDVRGDSSLIQPTMWEIMPDGSFYFSMEAGHAKLKTDGSGNHDCSTPMVAEMWGKIDCKDRDRVDIRLETVWWLGRALATPTPTPSSSPTSFPSWIPSGTPSGSPPWPPTYTPLPSFSPLPTGSPIPFPTFVSGPSSRTGISAFRTRMRAASGSQSNCKLPPGCYFHNLTKIEQCP